MLYNTTRSKPKSRIAILTVVMLCIIAMLSTSIAQADIIGNWYTDRDGFSFSYYPGSTESGYKAYTRSEITGKITKSTDGINPDRGKFPRNETSSIFTIKDQYGKTLRGICIDLGKSGVSGSGKMRRISNSSTLAKIAYYYGEKKGWDNTGVGVYKMRIIFEKYRSGRNYTFKETWLKARIEEAKNVTVPDSFMCYVVKPKNTKSQRFLAWRMAGSPAKLNFSKTSSDNQSLSIDAYNFDGIKYGIYRKADSVKVAEMTLAGNGSIKSAKDITTAAKVSGTTVSLYPGTYYVQEMSTNNSYTKSTSKKEFITKEGGTNNVTVKDEPKKGSLTFKKYLDGQEAGGYKFTFTHQSNPNIKYTATSAADGTVSVSNMYYGTYTITEEANGDSSASGDAPSSVTINSTSQTTLSGGRFNNETIEPDTLDAYIKLVKNTSDGKHRNDFSFTVYCDKDKDGQYSENEKVGGTASQWTSTNTRFTFNNGETNVVCFKNLDKYNFKIVEESSNNLMSLYTNKTGNIIKQVVDRQEPTPAIFTFTNEAKSSKVTLNKTCVDEQGSPVTDESAISGIRFDITGTSSTGANVNISGTTDNNGNIDFGNVPYGTYTIKETGFVSALYQTPTGWSMGSDGYPYKSINVSNSNVTVSCQNIMIIPEEPVPPILTIKKQSSKANDTSKLSYNFDGIVYTLYQDGTNVEVGKFALGANGTVKSVSITNSSLGTAVNNGTAIQVQPDSYYIKETSTNSYYQLDSASKNVTLDNNQVQTVTFTDAPKVGSLSFNKILIDKKGKEKVGKGYHFTLTHVENPDISYEATSDSDGKVDFGSNLYLGDYTLTETITNDMTANKISPSPAMPQTVTIKTTANKINDQNTYRNEQEREYSPKIRIKKSTTDGSPVNNFTFKLSKNVSSTSTPQWKTVKSGITVNNKGESDVIKLEGVANEGTSSEFELEEGMYKVEEETNATSNLYTGSGDVIKTLIIGQGTDTKVVDFEFTNTPKTKEVELVKTSSGPSEVSGIEFTVEGTTATGVHYKKTAVTNKVNESAQAIADFGVVPYGEYTITEDTFDSGLYKVPQGWTLSNGKVQKNLTVNANSNNKITLTCENIPYALSLQKYAINEDGDFVDAAGNTTTKANAIKIKGANFALYDVNPNVHEDAQPIDSEATDNNGKIEFNAGINKDKTYYLIETASPAGFEIDPQVMDDFVDEKPIIAKITFQQSGNNLTAKLTPESSLIGKSETITVGNNGKFTVEMYNIRKEGKINLEKYDNAGDAVVGAEFTLYTDENCTTVARNTNGKALVDTTDDYGTLLFENIPWNYNNSTIYYLKETSAPRGYKLKEDVQRIIFGQVDVESGTMEEVTSSSKEEFVVYNASAEFLSEFENERKPGKVELTKYAEGRTPASGNTLILSGAEYTLYNEDGSVYAENLITDNAGKITVENIPWGKYYFKEIKSPAGYAVSPEKVNFTVSNKTAGNLQKLTAEDPAETTTITAIKRLKAADIYWDHGTPTFTFELKGTRNGDSSDTVTHKEPVTFNKEYVESHTGTDGYVELSVSFTGLDVNYTYRLSEAPVIRYKLHTINGIENGSSVQTNSSGNSLFNKYVNFSSSTGLSPARPGKAVFFNDKIDWTGYSDTNTLTNNINKAAKFVSLNTDKDTYHVFTNEDIDWSELIKVFAVYDNDSEDEIPVATDNNATVTAIPDDGKYHIFEVDGSSYDNVSTGTTMPSTAGSSTYQTYQIYFTSGGITRMTEIDLKITKSGDIQLNFHYNPSGNEIDTKSWSSANDKDTYTIIDNRTAKAGLMATHDGPGLSTAGVNAIKKPTASIDGINYVFAGWYKAMNADGTFNAKDKVNIETTKLKGGSTHTVNLYARWKDAGFGTYLYPDGTLVINELPNNHGANVEAHGGDAIATYEAYINGETTWSSSSTVPWVADTANRNKIKHVEFGDAVAPDNMDFWFYDLENLETFDSTNLDTSNVTSMRCTFESAGNNATSFVLSGLDNWDTSKVTNMSYMFRNAGYNATTWNIGTLLNWDVSSVTNMGNMFNYAGYKAPSFNINLSNWNVSKVTNMSSMFSSVADKATDWSIGDLSGWNVSSVTNMNNMFSGAGRKATTWNIGNLANWNTSSVTNMHGMFAYSGRSSTSWSTGNLSGWNVSKVTDMSYMFGCAGEEATTWSIGNISDWNVSNVTDMRDMFTWVGSNATSWDIGDLANWNTSKVTNMSSMFNYAGYRATTWNIGNLSDWNISRVTDMSYMLAHSGGNSSQNNTLHIDNWMISEGTNVSNMFNSTSFTTIYCNNDWSNAAGTSSNMFKDSTRLVGGLGTAYDSSHIDKEYARPDDGASAPGYFTGQNSIAGTMLYADGTLILNETNMSSARHISEHGEIIATYPAYSDEVSWSSYSTVPWVADTANRANIKSVKFQNSVAPTTMRYWFCGCENLSSFDSTNLDTSNVTNMSYTFESAGEKVTDNISLDLSSWNTSKVTDMSCMFYEFAEGTSSSHPSNASLNLSGWNTAAVQNMASMFKNAGCYADSLTITGLNNWNTGNVTDMSNMFDWAGHDSSIWNIGSLSGWNVSKVTNMSMMFNGAGEEATAWSIGNLSSWNTGNVTNMSSMFRTAGDASATWNIGNLANWNTSKVTNMSGMFVGAGHSVTNFNTLNLSNWNVSKVTNMSEMFSSAGRNATNWSVGDISNWNTGAVTNMSWMFKDVGNIPDLTLNWNISNVTNMSYMFYGVTSNKGIKNIHIDNWNITGNVNLNQMFANSNIEKIDCKNDWTASTGSSTDMFKYAYSLTGGNGTRYNISHIDKAYAKPDRAPNQPGYFTKENELKGTILYSDGTLVINETENGYINRPSSYGAIKAQYPLYKENTTWNSASTVPWVADTTNRSNVKSVKFGSNVAPNNMAYWFYNCNNLTDFDSTNLNAGNVTSMAHMFDGAANKENVDLSFNFSSWNTSKVKDMSFMFHNFALNSGKSVALNVSNWNTGAVTNMANMFDGMSVSSDSISITGLSGWNVGNVINMSYMFNELGRDATSWNIGILSSWNVSKVTDMSCMFNNAGKSSTDSKWDIGNLNNWKTGNVTNMRNMFSHSGQAAADWNIGNISGWDVSKVTNMASMFAEAAHKDLSWSIGNLDNWNVGNVTDMSYMFYKTADNATTWNIGNLSNWNVSKVTHMNSMFNQAGMKATTFNIGNLDNWNTKNVTNMAFMFSNAGPQATSWNIGNLDNWNVSNVTDMQWMFNQAGNKATSFNIGTLANWNTAKVTNMAVMFSNSGATAGTYKLDLTNWKTSNVTDMNNMFSGAGANATTWRIGRLTNWDVGNVNNFTSMFHNAGTNSGGFTLDILNWTPKSEATMNNMFTNLPVQTIFCSKDWSSGTGPSADMFAGCNNLVGGKGSAQDSGKVTRTYAKVDTGDNNSYFTGATKTTTSSSWGAYGAEFKVSGSSTKRKKRAGLEWTITETENSWTIKANAIAQLAPASGFNAGTNDNLSLDIASGAVTTTKSFKWTYKSGRPSPYTISGDTKTYTIDKTSLNAPISVTVNAKLHQTSGTGAGTETNSQTFKIYPSAGY